MPNPWENDPIDSPSPFKTVTIGGRDPAKVRSEERAQATADRSAAAAERTAATADRTAKTAEHTAKNTDTQTALRLAGDYNSDPTVKSYRVAVSQLAQALGTGDGPQADLALTYAFAKAMDPESVVRDAEQGMQINSQPWLQSAVENVKKQFGMTGAGVFTPEARKALRAQIINSVKQRDTIYNARREFYSNFAEHNGMDPAVVIGQHDGAPFMQKFAEYDKSATQQPEAPQPGQPSPVHYDATQAPDGGLEVFPVGGDDGPADSYQASQLGQGMSGVNEGIASTLGAPVDIATLGLNLIPKGLNAVANTDLPTIEKPFMGSDWFQDKMGGWGIYDPNKDGSGAFTRRVGQSVGASLLPAGAAGSPLRAGAAMLSGAGGGVGAATAQQVFPGNPLAEILGEVAGGGITGGGLAKLGQRSAQREIESAIPTVDQLKEQAGELYRGAEARGVTADPAMTQGLSDQFRQALAKEGQISPTGRVSGVYPKAEAAMKMADDYAGLPMSPTQLQTMREVTSDPMSSIDKKERRMGSLLTDVFDQWAAPIAPELPQARDVASRYLAAEKLEQARDLADASSSQFSGSGMENALRTQYRNLDRSTIKGGQRFTDDVTGAIQDVNRGTPYSNTMRGLGKLYPSGVVSGGLGSVLPALAAGSATGSPTIGGAVGLGMAGLGYAGRKAGTASTLRAADIAELTARNGGAINQAPLLSPETQKLLELYAAAQAGKYLPQ